MILSRYVTAYPQKDDPGMCLLYSTKRTSSVLIPESMFATINNGGLDPDDAAALAEIGILVPDHQTEDEEMLSLFPLADLKRNFTAVAVMNLDCNLACRYCFEGTMKRKVYMSEQTANNLIDFTNGYLRQGKDVQFAFYGGEPLLSFELIKYISGRLKELAGELGRKYSFGLITNGTLLTRKRVEEIIPLGLTHAKVTLDGLAANHDLFRPFKSGTGSFDIIFKNMQEVASLFELQLGGNFTRENYGKFPLLLDYLLDQGMTPDKFTWVKFDPISKTSEKFALPDFKDGVTSPDEPWIAEASVYLREEVLRRGFKTQKMGPGPCFMQFRDDIVVNVDGTLYKCPAFMGLDGMDVGSLKTGIRDEWRTMHDIDAWKNDECLGCKYLPLCFGGCKFIKLLKDGNTTGVECRKANYDATFEALIRQDLKYLNAPPDPA